MQPNLLAAVTSDNPLHKSLYVLTNEGEEVPPPGGGFFKLLDGTNFLLLDNTHFLLLGP